MYTYIYIYIYVCIPEVVRSKPIVVVLSPMNSIVIQWPCNRYLWPETWDLAVPTYDLGSF